MKNFILIFCFISSPFLLISQYHTSIDIIGSYDIKNVVVYSFKLNEGVGKNKPSYRFGGNFNFKVFRSGFIKTGIRYVKQGYKVLEGRKPDGSHYQEFFDEYYLEVPISYRYEFSEKKFSLYTEVGVAPHFYLKGKRVQQLNSDITSSDFEIPYLKDRRVRLGFVIGVGFNYKLTRNLQIFSQPTYRFYPPLGMHGFLVVGNMNIGFEFGIRKALSFVNKRV